MPESPLERQLGKEQIEAYGLAADLAGLPFEKRRARARSDPKCQTPSFIRLALTLAREPDHDREDARQWLQIAIDASELAENCRASELLPVAWAVLGNHHRCGGELRKAARAFARAREHCGLIADPLDQAECLSLEASFWREIRDFEAASQSLEEAQRIASLFGGPHVRAKLHVKQGLMFVEAGSWEAAIYHLREGAGLASDSDQPPLVLAAIHNMVLVLVEMGAFDRASASLVCLQPLYEQEGSEKDCIHGKWLMGRCALGRGNALEASERLKKVRNDFLAQRDLYYASLVELDLVEAHSLLRDWTSAEDSASAAATGLSTAGATAEALIAVECLKDGLRHRLKTRVLLSMVAEARTQARSGS